MDDEAILARLDADPDAFAVFYRRHVAALMDDLLTRTGDRERAADLCSETFAVALSRAHELDPERGTAAAWLEEISRGLLARAERRGAVDDRARRRLGMAPLDRVDDEELVRALEEELVEAARFRARRRRPALPRPRGAAVAAAGIALVALAALALALGRGGDADRAANARRATPPPSGGTGRLLPMLEPRRCRGLHVRDEPAFTAMPDIGVLTDRAGKADAAVPPPEGDAVTWLPVMTFDPAEPRLARNRRLETRLHVVPSLGVSAGASCDPDDGPGVCLVAPGRTFRCFPIADVRAGRAFARTPGGLIVGILPDGVGRVTLSGARSTASVRVHDNVFEADLGLPAGAPVRVELPTPGADRCFRQVSTELLASVAALRRAPGGGRGLPSALAAVREQWRLQIDAVVDDGARLWGTQGGIEFWVVPVVRLGSRRCAPANRVCVVAASPAAVGPTGAACALHRRRGRAHWRLSPQLPDHAVIHGTVPDGVTGARVTGWNMTAEVAARDNVIGGVLPFPYQDGMRVELIRRPQPRPALVGVVDATGVPGVAANVLARLRQHGHRTLDAITPGVNTQPSTQVYWRPRRATRPEADDVAAVLRALEVRRIEEGRTPRPVLETGAAIVVVVGSEH